MDLSGQKGELNMNTDPRQYKYGLSTDLFVSRKDSDHTLVLGGVGQNEKQWVHVMTRRAAQVLWYKLTSLLYPDKADMVTSMASTAPLQVSATPNLTTHIEVVQTEHGYTLVGRIGRTRWLVQLTELEVRRLWAALDLALYPVGWEGRVTKTKKIN